MPTLLNMLLYLGSMVTLLGGVYVVGSYRQTQRGSGSRGDRDAAVWLLLVVLGGILSVMVFLITRAMA
jgi:hypothetical protein